MNRYTTLIVTSALAVLLHSGGSTARAQGMGDSLGGYGALAGDSASMGGYAVFDPTAMGAGVIMPMSGRGGVSMGGSGGIGLVWRPRSPMLSDRPRQAYTLGMLGGTAPMSKSSKDFGRRRYILGGVGGFDNGAGGLEFGIGRGPRRSPGVMPPSLGSPFRRPTPLPGATGVGSMSM